MFDTLQVMTICPTHLHRIHICLLWSPLLVENAVEFNILHSQNHVLRNYKVPLVKQKKSNKYSMKYLSVLFHCTLGYCAFYSV